MTDPNPPEHEMLDITVKVPKPRVGAFYEMFGRWLNDSHDTEVLPTVAETAERLPWNPDADLDLAVNAWKAFPPRAKAVFGTLIENPGTVYTGPELAKINDIPNGAHGVAGVLAHPGRQLKKLNRELHFKADGTSGYWMDPDLAAFFNDARARADRT